MKDINELYLAYWLAVEALLMKYCPSDDMTIPVFLEDDNGLMEWALSWYNEQGLRWFVLTPCTDKEGYTFVELYDDPYATRQVIEHLTKDICLS